MATRFVNAKHRKLFPTQVEFRSKYNRNPLAEPPVILNDLHVSDPSEAQNIIKECDNCALLDVKNRKLQNLTYCNNNIR